MFNTPNTAPIRKKLDMAFDDSTLSAFCFDYFPEVYNIFSQGMRKDDKIMHLLYYCRRSPTGFKTLLDNVGQEHTLRTQSSKTSHFQSELKPLIDALSEYIELSLQIETTPTSQRHQKFSHQKIEERTKTHHLWQDASMQQVTPIKIGIRSFLPWAENREEEVDELLCLVQYFNKRKIKAISLWNNTIFGELKRFFSRTMRSSESYHLHFDAHSSIAFATGYCLYPKSGVDVTLIQRSVVIGSSIWHGRNIPRQEETLWLDKQIRSNQKGQDVALAISIAQPVLDDVEIYVRDVLPSVRRIISLTIPPAPGPSTVRDGTHARQLAEDVSRRLQARLPEEKQGVLHIFAAAPVGFLFYLGQLAHSFGRCVSYEYAFEDNTPGGYQASFVFPPTST